MSSKWRRCFVPKCKNTGKNSPHKIFLTVPSNIVRRKRWFKAASRSYRKPSQKSVYYCCEDHFNLEEDMYNYIEHCLSKVSARIKPEVVPHIFTNRQDKTTNGRYYSEKRAYKRKDAEILNPNEISEVQENLHQQPSTTSATPESIGTISERFVTVSSASYDSKCPANPVRYSKSRQVLLPEGTIIKVSATSFLHFSAPIQIRKEGNTQKLLNTETETTTEFASSDSGNSKPSFQGNGDNNFTINDNGTKEIQYRIMFINTIVGKLRMYTGIPKENSKILDAWEGKSPIRKFFIYLTLYKMKTNDSFEQIGDLFGVSETYAREIFQKTCLFLVQFMNDLIFWPSKLSIKKNLPIPFRIDFSNVQSIIDCLEIEIEKPSSVKEQALTWSNNKKCNTVKYLISATPDGFINFVSEGYGGGVSDVTLFKNSGFLNVLPQNTVVMADGRFKKIETFLQKKNCTLVRPLSVSNRELMAKNDDGFLNTPIVNVERIIRQIRDFKILEPNSSVNLDLVHALNDIIVIACGIINLQKPIIKP